MEEKKNQDTYIKREDDNRFVRTEEPKSEDKEISIKKFIDLANSQQEQINSKDALIKSLKEQITTKSPTETPKELKPKTISDKQNLELSQLAEQNKMLTEQIKSFKEQTLRSHVDALITKVIAEKSGNVALLKPIIAQQVEINKEGSAVIKEENGTYKLNSETAKPYTLEEYVDHLKGNELYKPAFLSKEKSGPDLSNRMTTTHSNGSTHKKLSEWTGEEKVEYISKNGKDAFMQLLLKNR